MSSNALIKKLASGSLWAFGAKVSTAVLMLLSIAIFTRYLSPDEMGMYFLILSVVSFIALSGQLGINYSSVRLIAEALSEKGEKTASTLALMCLHLTVLGAAVVSIIAASGVWEPIFSLDLPLSIAITLGFWVFFLTMQGVIPEIFRGYCDIKNASIFGGVITSFSLLIVVFTVTVIVGGVDLESVIFITVIALLVNLLIGLYVLFGKMESKIRDEEVTYKGIIKISSPLWVTNIVMYSFSHMAIWVLAAYSTQENVALFGAAAKLVALISMPLVVVNAVLPPIIAEFNAKRDVLKLEGMLRWTATVTMIPAGLVVLPLLYYSDTVMQLVYGEFYENAGDVLRILIFGQFVNVFVGSCGYTLMMTGHQKVIMVISVISGLIITASCIIVVQSHGLIGVATVVAVGVAFQQVSMMLAVKYYCHVWTNVSLKHLISIPNQILVFISSNK